MEIIDAKFKVIRPKRRIVWGRVTFDWRVALGAAILGLPALIKSLLHH